MEPENWWVSKRHLFVPWGLFPRFQQPRKVIISWEDVTGSQLSNGWRKISLLYPLRMAVAPSLCQSCGVPVKRGISLEGVDGWALMDRHWWLEKKSISWNVHHKKSWKNSTNRWIFGGDDPIGLVNGWFKLPKVLKKFQIYSWWWVDPTDLPNDPLCSNQFTLVICNKILSSSLYGLK